MSSTNKVITGRDILNILNSAPEGLSAKQIASRLGVNEIEVKTILRNRLKAVCTYDSKPDRWRIKTAVPNQTPQKAAPKQYAKTTPEISKKKTTTSANRKITIPKVDKELFNYVNRSFPQTVCFFKVGNTFYAYGEHAGIAKKVMRSGTLTKVDGMDCYYVTNMAKLKQAMNTYQVDTIIVAGDKLLYKKYHYENNRYVPFHVAKETDIGKLKRRISRDKYFDSEYAEYLTKNGDEVAKLIDRIEGTVRRDDDEEEVW